MKISKNIYRVNDKEVKRNAQQDKCNYTDETAEKAEKAARVNDIRISTTSWNNYRVNHNGRQQQSKIWMGSPSSYQDGPNTSVPSLTERNPAIPRDLKAVHRS